eukprot:152974_1
MSDLDIPIEESSDDEIANVYTQEFREQMLNVDTTKETAQLHEDIKNAKIISQAEQELPDTQETEWDTKVAKYTADMYNDNMDKFGSSLFGAMGKLLNKQTEQNMDIDDDKDDNKEDKHDDESLKDIIASCALSQGFVIDLILRALDPKNIEQAIDNNLQEILTLHKLATKTLKELYTTYWSETAIAFLDYWEEDCTALKSEPDKELYVVFLASFLSEEAQKFVETTFVQLCESKEIKLISKAKLQKLFEEIVKASLYEYYSFCRALVKILATDIISCEFNENDFKDVKDFRVYIETTYVRSALLISWLPVMRWLFKVDGMPKDYKSNEDDKVMKVNKFIGAVILLLQESVDQMATKFEQRTSK